MLTFTLALSEQVLGQSHSESIILSGQVLSEAKPIQAVSVMLYEGNRLIDDWKTLDNGKFNFSLDPSKEYQIMVQKDGYFTKKLKVKSNLIASIQQLKSFEFYN